jgi:hypothetical protein
VSRAICSTKRIKIGNAKPIYFQVDWTDPPQIKLEYPAKYGGTTTGELCDRITRRVNALLRKQARSGT